MINRFTLIEVSNLTGLELSRITKWITKEWLSLVESEILDREDIARLRLIHDLQHASSLAPKSFPIILHLMMNLKD